MAHRARTAADVNTLLLELRRIEKALRFYSPAEPALVELMERARRAFSVELERGGPLTIMVHDGHFRLPEHRAPLGYGDLDDYARSFEAQGVATITFLPPLRAECFQTFVTLAAQDPRELAEAGGLGAALELADVQTVLVEGSGDASIATETKPLPAAPAPVRTPQARDWEELVEALEACDDDDTYAQLSLRLLREADCGARSARGEELLSAARVLWRDAVDGSTSDTRRRHADGTLRSLLIEDSLDDVMRRACGPNAEANLEASRLLLHLGADAAPRLVTQLESETDPQRSGQLTGLLVAMGEAAAPALLALLESGDVRRARFAAGVLGEMRSASAVPALARRVFDEDPGVRNEAVRALVGVGTPDACAALLEALACPREDVASLAAFGIGALRDPASLPALGEALERALQKHQADLGEETIKALGQIGTPEAVPLLAGVLERKSLLRGRNLREFKLAATQALGRIPGDEAQRALGRAADSRDSRVMKLAQLKLGRRSA